MTELIKQRYEKDCLLACLAMATGISYDAAVEKWGQEFMQTVANKGCYGSAVDHAFAALGHERDRDYTVRYLNLHDATVTFTKNLLWGRRACLQVRSKNYAGEQHIVYWNGHRLFDPSNKLTYTWEEVEPTYLWIFNEGVIS